VAGDKGENGERRTKKKKEKERIRAPPEKKSSGKTKSQASQGRKRSRSSAVRPKEGGHVYHYSPEGLEKLGGGKRVQVGLLGKSRAGEKTRGGSRAHARYFQGGKYGTIHTKGGEGGIQSKCI